MSRVTAKHSRSSTPIVDDVMDQNTEDEDEFHFTLKKSIDTSMYTHLFELRPKLTAENYTTWVVKMLHALQAVSLHVYLSPLFQEPTGGTADTRHHPVRWGKANNFVCSVLTASMTEAVQTQVGHLYTAAGIWSEVRRLYANTTATITALVTTRYIDGEDVNAHIAKMKGYRHYLSLMQRDIDDELFACFLRISMPPTWNCVFATLPDHYSSTEVEQRIRDKYGACTSQFTTSIAFQASRSNKTKDGRSRTPIPGQPYCTNCKISGHHTEDCYSKGRAMRGKWRERN